MTLTRLPFHFKHSLVRTAAKNGAVFEMNYCGAFGNDPDTSETVNPAIRRNWWASAREVVRVTGGKGIIVSGGVTNEPDLRAPRDITNLYVYSTPPATRTLMCSKIELLCWAWLRIWPMAQWERNPKPLFSAHVSLPTRMCLIN